MPRRSASFIRLWDTDVRAAARESPVRTAICICTFRRPAGLLRLLRSLEALQTTKDASIIVADNDPDGLQGFNLCLSLQHDNYRWPLSAFVVRERGLPSVRNAIHEKAFSDPSTDFVAMLDDDETVEPQWLDAMLDMQSRTGADIVGGAVIPQFETAPKPWMVKSKAYRRDEVTDGLVRELYGECNIFISRKILDRFPLPFFDPKLSLTGAHEVLFFRQAKQRGVTFARASRARAFEHYPSTRMTIRWVMLRAYRVGNSLIMVKRSLKLPARAWILDFMKISAALAVFPFEFLAFAFSPSRRVDALCRLSRAAGKIGALLGHEYEEYRTVHGK